MSDSSNEKETLWMYMMQLNDDDKCIFFIHYILYEKEGGKENIPWFLFAQ